MKSRMSRVVNGSNPASDICGKATDSDEIRYRSVKFFTSQTPIYSYQAMECMEKKIRAVDAADSDAKSTGSNTHAVDVAMMLREYREV